MRYGKAQIMRKPIIAGNWKMNKTPDEARELVNALKPLVKDASVDVVVCPPFVCIPAVAEAVKGSNIKDFRLYKGSLHNSLISK